MRDVVVVGAGQAGLALGFWLKQEKVDYVILDATPEVGASWRSRWDSLRLFTPAAYSALPSLRFPAPPDHLPGKDEVADYLGVYAAELCLSVELGARVHSVEADVQGYRVGTNDRVLQARTVVLATGAFQSPSIPSFANGICADVLQIHSSEYRNPIEMPEGDVLVVGAAASGTQIAEELAASRAVHLSVGTRPRSVPRQILGNDCFWWYGKLGHRHTIESPIGRWLSRRPDPLIGTNLRTLQRRHGIGLVPRAVAGDGHAIRLADGRTLRPSSIVWCTGYRPDYSWVHVPVFDGLGMPIHRRGVSRAPGLYFLGLSWQWTRGSGLIGWVGEDARFIASRIREVLSR